MLFAPEAPPRFVQYVPGHNRWHPDIPPVAEVIAGGSIRMQYRGADVLCGPVDVVGAEPGDLVTVEVLGIGRLDGGHLGILGCARRAGRRADRRRRPGLAHSARKRR